MEKNIQKARDNVNQNQISTQNNFHFSIIGDIIPIEFIKLFQSISTTFVTEKEFEVFQERFNESLQKIEKKNITRPSLSLWGATVDSLKWNLNEQQKYIRDMFINILVSDIDKTKKDVVQPSFIEIVKQLSVNDAIFLESIKELIKDHDAYVLYEGVWVIPLSDDYKNSDYDMYLFKVLHCSNEWRLIDEIIIDNLKRLNIISIDVDEYFHDNKYVGEDEIKKRLDYIFSSMPKKNKIRKKSNFIINGSHLYNYFTWSPDVSKIIITNTYNLKLTTYGKTLMEIVFEK